MAVYNLGPSAGGRIGEALGTGLSQGLSNLASQKFQQIQQRQQQSRLSDTLKSIGVNQEAAGLPENALNTYLKQQLQAPQQASYGQAIQQLLGGAEGEESTNQPQIGALNEKQAYQLGKLALQKQATQEKQQTKIREELKPIIEGQREDFKYANQLKKVAQRMLSTLEKNKEKFPTGAVSYVPETLFRDPDIRNYARDANQLVLIKAGSRKGQPTNFKVKLEQMAKVNLNQPIETQIQGLKDIINDSDEVFTKQKLFDDIRKKNKGNYPRDLGELLSQQETDKEEQISQQQASSELPDASEQYEPGSQWQTSDGSIYEYQNGSWNPIA